MTPFNPALLQTFITFVESKNITETAEKLYISQPAVTVHLQQLEHHIQQKLFITQGRRKVLTQFGKIFYQSVSGSWRDLQKSIEVAHWQAGDKSQFHLRIGGRQEILSLLAPKINFEGHVEFIPLSGKTAVDAILERRIDLAIVQNRPDTTDVVAKKLFSNSVVFAVSKSLLKGLSLKSQMKNSEWLKATPSLGYKKHQPPFLTEWWKEHKVDSISLKFACEDWNVIAELIAQGRGYSLIPEDIPLAKNVEIESAPAIKPIDFYLLYQKDLNKILDVGALF